MGPRPMHYNPAAMKYPLLSLTAAVLAANFHAASPVFSAPVVSEPVVIVAEPMQASASAPGRGALGTSQTNTEARESAASARHAESAHGPMSEVVLRALALLGTPYRWGGQAPGGFDCSGLVSHVVQQAIGVILPRSAAAMSQIGDAIERSTLRAGDLLFFITRRQEVSHVGIYVGEGRFVHATRTGGDVRVSALDERYWSTRFVGARRIAGQ